MSKIKLLLWKDFCQNFTLAHGLSIPCHVCAWVAIFHGDFYPVTQQSLHHQLINLSTYHQVISGYVKVGPTTHRAHYNG